MRRTTLASMIGVTLAAAAFLFSAGRSTSKAARALRL